MILYKGILYQALLSEGVWQQRKKFFYNLIKYKQPPNKSKSFMSWLWNYLIFKLQTFPCKDKRFMLVNNTEKEYDTRNCNKQWIPYLPSSNNSFVSLKFYFHKDYVLLKYEYQEVTWSISKQLKKTVKNSCKN